MDIQKIAEAIATTISVLLAIALGIYLLVKLPLWLVPIAFAVAGFLLYAFVGPAVAIFSFIVALLAKGLQQLTSRRHTRS